MTLEEFLPINQATDERMELINGNVIHFESTTLMHQNTIGCLMFKIHDYIKQNRIPDVMLQLPFNVILGENLVEPDLMVIRDLSKLEERYCKGAPEWIIEVNSPDTSRDMFEKLVLYINSGVKEYWVVIPEIKMVYVYLEKQKNILKIYNWSDRIPVSIYKDAAEPLSICLEELLQILP